MASSSGQRMRFFPKADAAVLSLRNGPAPARSHTVGPIYDPDNVDQPIDPWPRDAEQRYPPKTEPYAPASVPDKPSSSSGRYLRATLAENERLRLTMLWYYTRGILDEPEFLSGLQEKIQLAQESTDWEFAIVGILDVNYYIRLATIGVSPGVLPRGETICAHTVTQPPGSIFLLPNMLEDWRFQESPYTESGGLRAYAGAPLRLQNEAGECVGLGSLCVASSTKKEPLSRVQQQTLARLADWVVSDIVQCARARRQRERRRITDLITAAQKKMDHDSTSSNNPVLEILKSVYPEAVISLQPLRGSHVEVEGCGTILLSDFENGLWEDIDYIDNFIIRLNNQEPPTEKVVRVITAQCESASGPSSLLVASKDFRLVFDDVDSWFVQTCAGMLSQMWHKQLLSEALVAKEKFLRGFSHQLRTPIHGILGSVELLAEELKQRSADRLTPILERKPSEPTIYIDTIKNAGRDLVSIINGMITLNRWADIAVAERCYNLHTVHDLEKELAAEVTKTFSGDPRCRASVVFHQSRTENGADSFKIDLNLLRDCLLPLILNGIQNTKEGVVSVSTSLCSNSKELIIDIEDTGCGIEPNEFQRIFEPYEKIDMHSSGAGLGLTLATKFAALLNGTVELVSSVVGRGSHFKATFREAECLSPPTCPQLLISRLKNIPSTFHNMASSPNCEALRDNFTRLLTSQGFTASESAEKSFIIFDFSRDLEEHRKFASQISPEQVAICLVPTTDIEATFQESASNILYLKAPFVTLAMLSALEEIDERFSLIKNSIGSTVGPPLTPPCSNSNPIEDNEFKLLLDLKSVLPVRIFQGDSLVSTLPTMPNLSSTQQSRSPKPTTLIVDDNAINVRVMQMYCSKRKLPFHCAKDGKEAVEIFAKNQALSALGEATPIELVLMDLQMPVLDGIEATRQIRALESQNNWARSTLFMVSGQDSPADRVAAEGVGADDYYVKPVSVKTLDQGLKQYFSAFKAT